MSDTFPSPEAIRLSNALDNLGAAALDLEGYHDAAELALVEVIRKVYEYDPSYARVVFGSLTRRALQAIVRAADRHRVSVAFVESILASKEAVK